MASHTIDFELRVDNSKANKKLQETNAEADKLNKPRIIAPTPASQSKALVTANNASGQGETKTARSIGVGAGTGSAASDFAAQAQGLGGLVHVYATFAANIFAVSAAFSALSKAMDVTNLVKGLDQIGASTGKNLGSLAKQMVNVADGAISMQQAMSSTAMASAGGMTNQAILRMTEVAKKASLALGRDMTDSMDRITKGIIKTQPELLDELGIMTRVIPAQQEYARSIGKTAASLTDFEKRQAFANAVLAEGEKKFGAIGLDANPYSKVLASVNNLMQGGLELINKFLGPVLGLLASSPTGLAVALGGLATVLLKQALPALGMFRENAKRMEQETHARVTRQVKDQQDAAAQFDTIAAIKAEKDFQREAKTIKDSEALQAARFNRKLVGADVQTTLRRSPFDLTDADIAKISSKHDELAARTDEVANKQAQKLGIHLTKINALRQASSAVGDAAAEAAEQRDNKWWSHQTQMAKNLADLNKKAAQSKVLANAADNAATMGPVFAFKELNKEASALDAGRITRYATIVKGGFSIITSAISTAMNAFGVWMQLIGLALAGLAMLDTWLSKSAKESEAFSSSLETLTSSFANVDRTLGVIAKKDISEFLSVESTQAKANALNDLTGNLNDVVFKFTRLQDAQNGWDKFFDGFWDMFGKGSGDKLALGVSNSVISALKLMREGPAKEEAKKSIQSLFNTKVDLSSVKAFNASIKDLDKNEIQQKAKAIENMLSTASRDANNAASAMTGFKTALADIGRQSTAMSNAILPKDEFSKMGMELAKGSNQMAEALKDPINSLTILRELAGDIKTLSFLPPGAAAELGVAKVELDKLSISIATLEKELADAEDKKAKARTDYNNANKSSNTDRTSQGFKELVDSVKLEETRAKIVRDRLDIETARAETLRKQYANIPDLLNKASMELLTKGLANALNEASVVAAKGYISVLNAAGIGTAEETAKADQQAISGQMELVKANYANVVAQEGLKVSIDALTLINERTILEGKLNNSKNISEAASISRELDINAKKFAEVVKKGNILAMPRDQALKTLNSKNDTSTTLEDKQAMEQMTTYMYSLIGSEQQLAKLRAQSGAIQLTEKVGIIAQEVKHSKDLLDLESKKYTTEKESIDLAIQASGEYSSALNSRKLEVDTNLARIATEKDMLSVMQKIRTIQLAIDANKGKSTDKTDTAMQDAQAELEAIAKSAEAKDKVLKQSSLKTNLTGLDTLRVAEQERTTRIFRENEAITNARNDAYSEELTYLNSIGVLKGSDLVAEKAKLDIKKQQSAYATESLNLENNANNTLSKLAIEYQLAEAAGQSTEAIQARMVEESASIERQKALLDIVNEAKLRGISLTAEQLILSTRQTEEMAVMQSITDSLSTIFGEMGTNIGKAAEAFASMGQEAERYAATEKRRAELQATLDNGVSSKEAKIDAAKDLAKIESDHSKNELKALGATAGATKKLFGEKTAAYKILDGIEKASAAYRLAMEMKEMAVTVKNWAVRIGLIEAEVPISLAATETKAAAELTAEAVTLPAKAAGGAASLVSQGGFVGMAAIGVFLALLASLGGDVGSVSTSGLTAADRQALGSGQEYQDGKVVNTNNGVLGDPTAKSQSIESSLQLIAETTVQNANYSNRMVELLSGIKDGITGVAKSVYSTIGLASGSLFGTKESSGGSPGILGMFATSSSTEILDSGLQFTGTLGSVMKDVTGSIKYYEDVLKKSSSSGIFGLLARSSEEFIHNMQDLEPKVLEQIQSVFNNAGEMFLSLGARLGMTEKQVMDGLSTVPIDKLASLKGLKGADLESALSSIFSEMFDKGAASLFSSLKQFGKFGEGMLETVARVLDNNDKVRQAFTNIGLTFGEGSKTVVQGMTDLGNAVTTVTIKSIEATEALIKASGGLQPLLDNLQSFFDNFYSETEKLSIGTANLSTSFSNLGIQMPRIDENTKSWYRGLVESAMALDQSDSANARYLSGLLSLNGAVNSLASAAMSAAAAIASAASSMAGSLIEGISGSLGELAGIDAQAAEDAASAASSAGSAASSAADAAAQAAEAARQAMIAAGKSISDFINTIVMEANKLAGTEQLLTATSTTYMSDLALAQAGDLEASKRIPTSGRAYLDAQVGSSKTSIEARKAMLIMANQLKLLPAVKTYEESLLEGVQQTASNTAAMAKKMPDPNIALGIKLDIEARSELLKLVTFIADTERLPTDLKELALATSSDIEKTINIIAASKMPADLKNLARLDNISVIKNVEIIVTSGASHDVMALALSAESQVTKSIAIILNSKLDVQSKTLALAKNEEVNKTIVVIVNDSALSDDQKQLAISNSTRVSKLLSYISTSTLSKEDVALALAETSTIDKVTNLIINGEYTSDQKTLALQGVTNNTKTISIAINDVSMTDEQRSTLLKDSYSITKTIDVILNDTKLSSDERTVALQTTTYATRQIELLMQTPGMTTAERLAAIEPFTKSVKTIQAILDDTSLSAAERAFALDKEFTAIKKIKVETSIDSTSLETTKSKIETTLDKFSSTIMAVADPAALTEAKAKMASMMEGITATLTPQSSPADIANARKTIELALNDKNGVFAQITAGVDPATVAKAKAILQDGVNGIFADITAQADAASAEKARETIKSFTDGIMATVGVTSSGQEANVRTTIETALSSIVTAVSTKTDGNETATRKTIETAIADIVAVVSSKTDGSTPDATRKAIEGAVAGIVATVSSQTNGSERAVADSISSTVDGIMAVVGVATTGSETTVADTIVGAVSNIVADIGVKIDGASVSAAQEALDALTANRAVPIHFTVTMDNLPIVQPIESFIHYKVVVDEAPKGAVPSALGNVFTPFALGGLPRNTVLNSPLLFDMGLAGEAGPEAIMPLKRGKDGNLGVRASINVGSSRDSSNDVLVAELQALRKQVEQLQKSNDRIVTATGKTKDLLARVTLDGEAMLTQTY